jgi:Ni/Fe-hydrogenase subunit HybB-like protein
MNVRTVKTMLWFLLGAGLTVIALRIIHGPGAVVALTDLMPWGLWKGGGVVAMVPIGGAGFTLAAFVSVFHWKIYRPLYLGAVLLGLMCYSSVAAGLTFDIGIWWRIVFPLTFWQFHSTLFEIAWCIMLYLGVLTVEFSHPVLEKFHFHRTVRFLEKFGIVFVIAGICLSTLHQSSLGTLFLATPYRLHPLWHTDLLPFLFFITSIGLGCLTISWVAIVVHRLYGAEQPMKSISGLGRIACYVLAFYLLVRFAGIVVAGEAGLLIAPTWDTANFWIEILLSALLPAALLLNTRFRKSPLAMFWISSSAILGVSLNRVNVAGLATVSSTHQFYIPAWTEWAATIGILSAAGLAFLFLVERVKVFDAIDAERIDAAYAPRALDRADWKTIFFHSPQADARIYSVAFVLSVGIALVFMPDHSIFGLQPDETPARGPRLVELSIAKVSGVSGVQFYVPPVGKSQNGSQDVGPNGDSRTFLALMIDANRDGDYVLFDHDMHIERQGGRNKGSCIRCHHMKKPYEEVSECSGCHADMYLAVDIFSHSFHVERTNGNDGCVECHTDPSADKLRENAKACSECHETMRPEGTLVEIPKENQTTMAPGYMNALHTSCMGCHEQVMATLEEPNENFTNCTHCHRDLPRLEDANWTSRL